MLARLLRETSGFFHKHKTFACGNPFLSSCYAVSCPFINKRQSTPHLLQHAIDLYLMPEGLFEKDTGNPTSCVQACHEQLKHESHLWVSLSAASEIHTHLTCLFKNYFFCEKQISINWKMTAHLWPLVVTVMPYCVWGRPVWLLVLCFSATHCLALSSSLSTGNAWRLLTM